MKKIFYFLLLLPILMFGQFQSDDVLNQSKSSADYYTKVLTNRASQSGGVTVDRAASVQSIRDSSLGLGRDILKINNENNLLINGEKLDNSSWVKSNVSVSKDIIANPIDGALTADLMVDDTANTFHFVTSPTIPIIPSATYTISMYAKAGGINFLYPELQENGSNRFIVDLTSGAVVNNVTGVSNIVILPLPNGWYRISFTKIASTSSLYLNIFSATSSATASQHPGNGISGIYLFGVQIERGSVATPYYGASYVYNPSTYGEGKTYSVYPKLNNLLLWSEDFTNAVWNKSFSTITANATTDPFGGNNASRLTENASTSSHGINQIGNVIKAGTTITASVYAKYIDRAYLVFGVTNNGDKICWINITNGTIGTKDSALTANVSSVGNGWYRCSVTYTATVDFVAGCPFIDISNTDNVVTYTGNGTSGMYIYGAQLEASPFATPYQKTTSIQLDSDLAFTRATTATVTNKDGSIGDSCYNLMPNSEAFSSAAWSKQNASVTANVIANPINGLVTASKLVESNTAASHQIFQPAVTTINTNNKYSFYAKAAERTQCMISETNGSISFRVDTFIDLITGAVLSGTNLNVTTTNAGNGWWRITAQYTSNSANSYMLICPSSGQNIAYLGDGVSGIYIFGAQVEQGTGTTPRDYLKTTNRLNVSRMDCSLDLTKPSLLIEKASTNFLAQSENIGAGNWVLTNSTSTLNTTLNPFGVNKSYYITDNTGNGVHFAKFLAATISGVAFTLSFYIKKADDSWVQLAFDQTGFGSGTWINFNFDSGTFGNSGGVGTWSVTPSINGYYKVVGTTPAISSASFYPINIIGTNNTNSATGFPAYIGTTRKFCDMAAGQIEQSPFATTYIPTTGSNATRNAETSFVDLTNNSLLNQNNFTLYGEGYLYNGATTDGMIYLGSSTTTAASNDSVGFYNQITPQFYTSSAYSNSGLNMGSTGYYKFAIQRNGTNVNFFRNGSLIWTQTVPVSNYNYLCVNNGGSTFTVSKLELYKETLSDAALITKTDIDAQAFLKAANITDLTQTNAITYLVNNLKSNGLWTKMNAIYPFVGGTATTHKFNLKDPRDLDAAFRLSFVGSVTHDSNGITPVGTGVNYGNTFLTPTVTLTPNSSHMSIYSRTNSTSVNIDMGCTTGASVRMMMQVEHTDGRIYCDMYGATADGRVSSSLSSLSSQGLFVSNRSASNILNVWRNSTKLSTNSTTLATSPAATPIFVGSANGLPNTPGRNYAFATIGSGLTDADAANLYTIVQQYQTMLSRQVN